VDPILYWNEIVNEADRTTHTTGAPSEARSQGPCGSSRAYAMMHLAMHDAYFSINSKPHGTYLANLQPQPKSGADTDSAIAAAAHATLSVLYPTQKAFFDARHAAAGLPGARPVRTGLRRGQGSRHAASAAQPDRSPDRGRASQMTSLPTPGSLRWSMRRWVMRASWHGTTSTSMTYGARW
jgi:hypothetical protein